MLQRSCNKRLSSLLYSFVKENQFLIELLLKELLIILQYLVYMRKKDSILLALIMGYQGD